MVLTGSRARQLHSGGAGVERDVFDETARTWIGTKLDQGQAGRAEVNRHVMEVYAWPLEVFLGGIPFLRNADRRDIVEGFFADRLDRPKFFDDWRASGRRLRHWLMTAVRLYVREQYRRDQRRRLSPLPSEFEPSERAVPEAEQAYVVSLVERACDVAAEQCRSEGLDDHWAIFLRRFRDGHSYADFAHIFDVDERRAAVMARTARKRFKTAIEQLLACEGIPAEEQEDEIRSLLEALHR